MEKFKDLHKELDLPIRLEGRKTWVLRVDYKRRKQAAECVVRS
jgi:hypothetical protein